MEPLFGGSVNLNAGYREVSLVTLERACLESPLNVTTAGDKIVSTTVYPNTWNPICDPERETVPNSYTVIGNTYLDPSDFSKSLNLGKTRDTDQKHGKQEVGNDLGQGYKVAAHTMGGDPCWIGMKDLKDGTIEVAGFAINKKMGKLCIAKETSDTDQITWVGWKIILDLTDMDTSRPLEGRTRLVSPCGFSPKAILLQRLLFLTDLPFCMPGTSFDNAKDGQYIWNTGQERRVMVANEDRLIKQMIDIFYHWQDWRTDCIAKMVQKSGYTEEEVSKHYDACSISIAHDIDNHVFRTAPRPLASVPTDMVHMADAHCHCVAGSDLSLCAILCGNVNWDHFEKMSRHVAIYIGDHDVYECCPYMPADRILSQVCMNDHFSSVDINSSHGFLGKMRIAKSGIALCEDRYATLLGDANTRQRKGIPTIEWTDSGEPRLNCDDLKYGITRPAPFGCVVRRAGGVLNPYNPQAFSAGSGPLFQTNDIQTAERNYAAIGEKLQSSSQKISGKNTCRIMLSTAGEVVASDDNLQEKMDEFFDALKEVGPTGRLTIQKVAGLLSTKNNHSEVLFGPAEEEDKEPPKFVCYDLIGAGASVVLDINPDMYDIDINKTKLHAKANGPSVHLLYREVIKHMIMFSLANTLRAKYLRRLEKMNAEPEKTANTFVSRERTCRKRSDPTAAIVPRMPLAYETMGLEEWVNHLRSNWDGNNEIIYKDADKHGWNIRLDQKRNQSRFDFYLKNQQYVDVIPGNGIASIKQLKLFEAWEKDGFADTHRPIGLNRSFRSRNIMQAVLIQPPSIMSSSSMPLAASVGPVQPGVAPPIPAQRGTKRQLTTTEIFMKRWDEQVGNDCHPKFGFKAGNYCESNITPVFMMNRFLKDAQDRTDLSETEREAVTIINQIAIIPALVRMRDETVNKARSVIKTMYTEPILTAEVVDPGPSSFSTPLGGPSVQDIDTVEDDAVNDPHKRFHME